MKKVRVLILVVAAALASSCGYRLYGAGKLPEGVEPIFIPTFENKTGQAGLESTVTSAVVLEFTKRNQAALAASESEAAAVMRGVIQSVTIQTISTRKKDVVGERRVTLQLDVRMVRSDGRVVWAAKGITDNESYTVSDDTFLNERKQKQTLGIVAVRIAERLYNRLTDNF
jgi:outer membrane lipopolysaccharide assembly protein LptE/RlpB